MPQQSQYEHLRQDSGTGQYYGYTSQGGWTAISPKDAAAAIASHANNVVRPLNPPKENLIPSDARISPPHPGGQYGGGNWNPENWGDAVRRKLLSTEPGRNAIELLMGGQSAGQPLGTSSGILNNPITQSIIPGIGEAKSGKVAAEAAEEVEPVAAKAIKELAPKGFAERVAHARDLLGGRIRDSLASTQKVANSYASRLFDTATKGLDAASPNGITTSDALASKINSIIADESSGIPELEDRVKAELPKEVRKLLVGEPSELEQASVFKGRRVGFTGRSASQVSEVAARLRNQGMTDADIRSALTNLGYSARDVDAAALGSSSSGVTASRLNEIQREIGQKAFGSDTPEARILKKIYFSISKDLDAAAAKSGPETQRIWNLANKEWSRYVQTFREGPIGKALEADTASGTLKNLSGENLRTVTNQLAHYAQKGDKSFIKAMQDMREMQRIDSYDHALRYIHSRWLYALIWPLLTASRGEPGKAAEEAGGIAATQTAARKLIEYLMMRGVEVPPIVP